MKPPRIERGIFVQQAPDFPQGPGGSHPERRERSLAGKTVFITGGNRDVGAGIVNALLEKGANIASVHRHLGPTTQKRVDEITAKGDQLGSHVEFTVADLTLEGARAAVAWLVEHSFQNKVDIVILNTSGPTDDINVVANNALVDWFLDVRRQRKERGEELEEGTIVLMQSVPGHFFAQLQDVTDLNSPLYDPVAASKYKGEQSLRARINEYSEQGVNLIVVSPPIVEDTTNMTLFRRQDPGIDEKMKRISEILGLPYNIVSTETVGQKVAELLARTDLPQGYVELFGNAKDARMTLSQWYGDNVIFVDTIEITGEDAGIGRMIVTRDYCEGHFNERVGMQVLPGFIIEEAASQAFALVASGGSLQEGSMPLLIERSAKFSRIAKPGEVLTLDVQVLERERRNWRGEVSVKNSRDEDVGVVRVKGTTTSKRVVERLSLN